MLTIATRKFREDNHIILANAYLKILDIDFESKTCSRTSKCIHSKTENKCPNLRNLNVFRNLVYKNLHLLTVQISAICVHYFSPFL